MTLFVNFIMSKEIEIMKRMYLILFSLAISVVFSAQTFAQSSNTIRLDLAQTVQLANDSSLSAFRAKNMYMASYWEYRSFRAERLPSLTLYMTPLSYNRDFTRRYDSEQDIDIFRQQQSLYTYGNIAAQQNLDITGGTFFVDSELG